MAYHPDPIQQPPLQLDLRPLVHVASSRRMTIAERFEEFHRNNPWVYDNLRRLALTMQSRGLRQWGVKAAFEVLRFQAAMQTSGDEYKLNNNYTSHYARLLAEREPRLANFFETRKLQRR